MKKLFFFIVVACMALTSCSTYRVNSKGRTMEPLVSPLYATVDVRPNKITYTYQVSFKKNEFVDEKSLCDNAVYEALIQAKADVLVAPTFKVESEIDGRKYYTITVTGYPADFTEFVQEKPRMAPVAIDIKELKKDGAYIIVDKDQNGVQEGYRVVGIEGPCCPNADHNVGASATQKSEKLEVSHSQGEEHERFGLFRRHKKNRK